MTPELEATLLGCTTLPSPPIVATKIITLANAPDVEIDEIVKLIATDPALSSKLLRTANSPLYPNRKKIEILTQAILVLGLNATLSLALSFSLVKSLRNDKSDGLDYELFWRRAFLAGAVSGPLGKACHFDHIEELFIAALIQDIGMLALDRVMPDLYRDDSLNQSRHRDMVAHEQHKIGTDHAAVGGWLLAKWNFPERLIKAVTFSEDPDPVPSDDALSPFIHYVSYTGKIAELCLCHGGGQDLATVVEQGERWLGLNQKALASLLEQMDVLITEAEGLFDTDIRNNMNPEWLIETARDLQTFRNLQVIQKAEALGTTNSLLESENQHLAETNRRDSLTELYNRAHIDDFLAQAFQKSSNAGKALSLVFADLDKFKSINDTYGHDIGDQVIKKAAGILKDNVRSTDCLGRYGGEEFVLVLPGTDQREAELICERVVQSFRSTVHEIGPDQQLPVTVSLGVATHEPNRRFDNASAFLKAADHAMYSAKCHGRDQWASYTDSLLTTGVT